jgi:DNA-binding transcriptional ArsR family regulator
MTNRTDGAETSTLLPDDAFAALGNEIRVEVLKQLGTTEGPLSFSELRSRLGMDDPGQFNYHLGELKGHFIRDTDDGYELRKTGNRVVEAVLSGAVTDAPILEPTRLDAPCPYCSADVEISYHEERLSTRCTECAGSFAGSESSTRAFGMPPYGTIALFYLPPAGLQSRTPRGILDAAFKWTHLEYVTLAAGICPRCSGTIEHSINVCEDHETVDDEVCERCNARFAVTATVDCSNCPRYQRGPPSVFLVSKAEVASFLTDHGMNPIDPTWERVPPAVLNYGGRDRRNGSVRDTTHVHHRRRRPVCNHRRNPLGRCRHEGSRRCRHPRIVIETRFSTTADRNIILKIPFRWGGVNTNVVGRHWCRPTRQRSNSVIHDGPHETRH